MKNYYFDLKFAVYLAITVHYDVLKGIFQFFDSMIRVVVAVVVVSVRSRLAVFVIGGDSSHFFHYFSSGILT